MLVFGVVYQDFLKALPHLSNQVKENSGTFYISPESAEEFFQKFPNASVQYKGHTLYNACQVENICSLKSDGNFPTKPASDIRPFPGWGDSDTAFAGLG